MALARNSGSDRSKEINPCSEVLELCVANDGESPTLRGWIRPIRANVPKQVLPSSYDVSSFVGGTKKS